MKISLFIRILVMSTEKFLNFNLLRMYQINCNRLARLYAFFVCMQEIERKHTGLYGSKWATISIYLHLIIFTLNTMYIITVTHQPEHSSLLVNLLISLLVSISCFAQKHFMCNCYSCDTGILHVYIYFCYVHMKKTKIIKRDWERAACELERARSLKETTTTGKRATTQTAQCSHIHFKHKIKFY